MDNFDFFDDLEDIESVDSYLDSTDSMTSSTAWDENNGSLSIHTNVVSPPFLQNPPNVLNSNASTSVHPTNLPPMHLNVGSYQASPTTFTFPASTALTTGSKYPDGNFSNAFNSIHAPQKVLNSDASTSVHPTNLPPMHLNVGSYQASPSSTFTFPVSTALPTGSQHPHGNFSNAFNSIHAPPKVLNSNASAPVHPTNLPPMHPNVGSYQASPSTTFTFPASTALPTGSQYPHGNFSNAFNSIQPPAPFIFSSPSTEKTTYVVDPRATVNRAARMIPISEIPKIMAQPPKRRGRPPKIQKTTHDIHPEWRAVFHMWTPKARKFTTSLSCANEATFSMFGNIFPSTNRNDRSPLVVFSFEWIIVVS